MTSYTSSTGVTKDFSISVERILELEEKDPGYSLVNDVRKLPHTFRLTSADRICRALGTTYNAFIADGFYMEDLARIAADALSDLHFFKPSPTSSEDLPQES